MSTETSPRLPEMLGLAKVPSRASSALSRTITTAVVDEFGDGGPATEASVSGPQDILVAADGDIFFSGLYLHVIRRIDAQTGIITSVAGNGFSGEGSDLAPSPTNVPLGWPFGMTFDAHENLIFADFTNNELRFVNRSNAAVTAYGVTIPAGDSHHRR